jgi:hypothetical protein
MPAATVSHDDEGGPAEGRTMNDEVVAMIAAAARLPVAERQELIEAIADTLADEACGALHGPARTAQIAASGRYG